MDEFEKAMLQWQADVLARLDRVLVLLEYQHTVTQQLMADRAQQKETMQ